MRMLTKLHLFLFFCLFTLPGYSLDIKGVIKDTRGSTLPGASVYLGGYKKGAVADNDGQFIIYSLSPGNYDVIIQMIGFEPYSQSISIEDKSVELTIVLKENTKLLDEVIIKPDPYRMERLKLFQENFLGTSANAKSCKIVNLDDIDFDYDSERHILTASSRDFLIIENKNLGYRIKYLLREFLINDERTIISYYGYPTFQDLDKNGVSKKRYVAARQLAYLGSPEHFFRALYKNTTKTEGYIIKKLFLDVPNPDKAPDSVIKAKLKEFAGAARYDSPKARKDSLKFWTRMSEKLNYLDILHREEILPDTLVKSAGGELKSITFDEALYIAYMPETETRDYKRQQVYRINRPDDLDDYQISVMYKQNGPVQFYRSGILSNPTSIMYKGYWSYEKVGDLVPLDYVP